MPTFDGHSLVTPTSRIPSAKLDRTVEAVGARVGDAYLGGKNIKVANKHIIVTTLKRSLKFDSLVDCFDINLINKILLLCCGNLVYVINLDTNVIKAEVYTRYLSMGKQGGSSHKATIKGCCINIQGNLGATCGEDKRIIVWDFTSWKAGHKGTVYQVEFSADSERLLSCSDDGRVSVWDWRSGFLVNSIIRHPTAVRTFDFDFTKPDLIVCGCNDGHITAWDTSSSTRIDDLIPDNEWFKEESIGVNLDKNHTASILCVRLSADRQLLATCSSDDTCKVWGVASYQKDINAIKENTRDLEKADQRLNGYIDVLDEAFNEQLIFTERQTLCIGELPINSGYHADLRFTLQHEAPVVSVTFSINSDLLITGSMDSTCRIWSSRRGEPLFQINLPSPVTQMKMDFQGRLYCACESRILVFTVKPMFKEADLPNYWQTAGIKKKLDSMEEGGELEKDRPEDVMIPLSELRKLIAHGVVSPDAVHQLGKQHIEIDLKQLDANMVKYNLMPQQILRLIANSRFTPKDIMLALSSKNPRTMVSLITQGASVTSYMLHRGYKMLAAMEDPVISLNFRNLSDPSYNSKKDRTLKLLSLGLIAKFDYAAWWREHFSLDSDEDSEDEEFFGNNDRPRDYQEQIGRIIHFIPSEHMKILKDLQSNLEVKPIFMRSIARGGKDHPTPYPNFRPGDEIPDPRPKLKNPVATVRFNEQRNTGRKSQAVAKRTMRQDHLSNMIAGLGLGTDTGSRFNSAEYGRMGYKKATPPKSSRWNRLGNEVVNASSQMLKPEKFMQTRGLSISFSDTDLRGLNQTKQNRTQKPGLFSTPVIFGGNRRSKFSMPVTDEVEFQEENVIRFGQ